MFAVQKRLPLPLLPGLPKSKNRKQHGHGSGAQSSLRFVFVFFSFFDHFSNDRFSKF